jgi:hydroxymethylpyrimidine/phosphomethylpyrimidine kinase
MNTTSTTSTANTTGTTGTMSTMQRYIRVLSIAGSDSGGGAGIQADLKTISALGCYGMTAITAITAQNTLGVTAIHPVPPDMLSAQMDAVLSDIGADAVKIGMLHDSETIAVVQHCLRQHAVASMVLDPVMVATSGAVLIQPSAISALVRQLFPVAALITPNLDEASLLVGYALEDEAAMLRAGQQLLDMGAQAALIKGGHMAGGTVCDVLVRPHVSPTWWRDPRIDTINTHGTGCTLSSAIACNLAQGVDLVSAITSARHMVRAAIATGTHIKTGSGSGPLNHLSAPMTMHTTL